MANNENGFDYPVIQLYKSDGTPEGFNFDNRTGYIDVHKPDDYIINFNVSGCMSTYYNEAGSVMFSWIDASVISLTPQNPIAEVSVYLYPEAVIDVHGMITISGNIFEDNGIMDKAPALKAQVSKNATVRISSKPSSNSVYTPISTQYTGEFEFTNMPQAYYLITVEIAGYEQGSIEIYANDPDGEYSDNNFIADPDSKTITPESTSSIDILPESKFSIFHNPKTNIVSIKGVEEKYSVRIINIRGQVVRSINNSSSELYINNISSGVYFVQVEPNGKIDNYKIVKR